MICHINRGYRSLAWQTTWIYIAMGYIRVNNSINLRVRPHSFLRAA